MEKMDDVVNQRERTKKPQTLVSTLILLLLAAGFIVLGCFGPSIAHSNYISTLIEYTSIDLASDEIKTQCKNDGVTDGYVLKSVDYSLLEEDFTFDSTYKGKPVIGIEKNVFSKGNYYLSYGAKGVKKIHLPKQLKYIA